MEVIAIQSIKKNFLYNAFYNILVLILPIITAPYISRVMGAEKIGVYSYSYSIVSYFGLFILLGLSNYGNRTVASVRENREKLSKTFCAIYGMQIIMGLLVILLYLIYIIYFSSNKTMAIIQLIYLLSVTLDINWFFFGLEQFKLTVTRNTIIKIITMILIFTFVNNKNDIYIYAIIMQIGPLTGQLILWRFLKKYIDISIPCISDIKKHIKPNIVLFIPVIALSLYTIMDKVMLGLLSNMIEVGYYENANKLTIIPTMAITSLGTVMLPRISNLIANGDIENSKKYTEKSLIFSVILSSSMSFGLSAISKEFVPFFYGTGYEKCIQLIPILVFATNFISWGNVLRTQYLIPNSKDIVYIKSAFLGAVVNVVINLLLIHSLKSIGTAIGTLFAEAAVCLYISYKVKKHIKISKIFKLCIPLMLIGFIMYIIVINVPFISSNLITLVIKVAVGGIVYLALFLVYYKMGLNRIISLKRL